MSGMRTGLWLPAVALWRREMTRFLRQKNRIVGALATPLVNPSPLGGQERITVYTTFLVDGTLFYYLTIAPDAEVGTYAPVFQRIGQSIRLAEAR